MQRGREAIEQLMAVNDISLEQADELLANAAQQWQQRNMLIWTIKVAPDLVARFPNLEKYLAWTLASRGSGPEAQGHGSPPVW